MEIIMGTEIIMGKGIIKGKEIIISRGLGIIGNYNWRGRMLWQKKWALYIKVATN
jgi:hypothetical protein